MDFTTTVWRKVGRYREIFAARARGTARPGRPCTRPSTTGRCPGTCVPSARPGSPLTAFEEAEPTEEFAAGSTQAPWIAEIPLHCAIEARKD